MDAEKYGPLGNMSFFFLVLCVQLLISVGKVDVFQGSSFTTIGIMARCIEGCWGVARNGTGNLDGLQ